MTNENLIVKHLKPTGLNYNKSDLIKMARAVSEGEQVDFNAFLSGSGIYRWD